MVHVNAHAIDPQERILHSLVVVDAMLACASGDVSQLEAVHGYGQQAGRLFSARLVSSQLYGLKAPIEAEAVVGQHGSGCTDLFATDVRSTAWYLRKHPRSRAAYRIDNP